LRRDSNDTKWQEVKNKVKNRDKVDRMLKILNPIEYKVLKSNAGYLLNILDPAHYLAVSDRPDLCYKSYNIVLLNRYSHEMLDSFKNPINGESITKEEVQLWWERILKGDNTQYQYLKSQNLL
jgi:hypothetical protein